MATATRRPASTIRRMDLITTGNCTPLLSESAPGFGRIRNHLQMRIAIAIAVRTVDSQAIVAVGVETDIIENYSNEICPSAANAGLRLNDLLPRGRTAFDHEKDAIYKRSEDTAVCQSQQGRGIENHEPVFRPR